jgi:putative GTP pyrophosphokinase
MKYSRKQISNAGNTIMTSRIIEEVDAAIIIINDWRSNHLLPLNIIGDSLASVLKTNGITPVLTSKRLKRLTSIQYKLDLNPLMGLGGMQDIGGYRIVVDNVSELIKIQEILKDNNIADFELEKIDDYIQNPKTSGYRSIHFRYKYHSDFDEFDGLRIELQVRTKLQHSWATAVETAGLYTKTSLKSSQGRNEWLIFFKVVSSLFSIKEQLPVMTDHRSTKMPKLMIELMVELYKLDQDYQFTQILKALKVTINTVAKKNITKEYCIVNIDLVNNYVKIYSYDKVDEDQATTLYSELEKNIEDNKNAVVLVAVNSIKELRAAYPSYFLDTTEFINALEKIKKNCKELGWV